MADEDMNVDDSDIGMSSSSDKKKKGMGGWGPEVIHNYFPIVPSPGTFLGQRVKFSRLSNRSSTQM